MKSKHCQLLLYFLTLLAAGVGIAVYESEAADYDQGRVTAGVNLRAAPGLAGKVITGLEKGSIVAVTGEQAGWYQIAYEVDAYGYRGWVYGKYIEKIPAAPSGPDTGVTAVENSQPAPTAAVKKSTPRPEGIGISPGDAPLPELPANTIEQIQAAAAPPAVAAQQKTVAAGTAEKPVQSVMVAKKPDLTTEPPPPTGPAQARVPVRKQPPPSAVSGPVTVTAARPPGGKLLSLALKLSSVLLSCLALMISYRTFHLVSAGRSLT